MVNIGSEILQHFLGHLVQPHIHSTNLRLLPPALRLPGGRHLRHAPNGLHPTESRRLLARSGARPKDSGAAPGEPEVTKLDSFIN